jgi:hypothetical protein
VLVCHLNSFVTSGFDVLDLPFKWIIITVSLVLLVTFELIDLPYLMTLLTATHFCLKAHHPDLTYSTALLSRFVEY